MSDFPRGWTFSVSATGVATTLIVAGIAGVTHVLDAVTATFQCDATYAGGAVLLTVSTSDGAFTSYPLAVLALAGNAIGIDSQSPSGLNIAGGPGASLTLNLNNGANMFGLILAQGHDI